MAQIFLILFFSWVAIGAVLMIVAMLRQEWIRIAAILSGAELAQTQAYAPRVRIRQWAWGRPESHLVTQRRAVAA
jgi:hypothetical protein